jgi:hypothetical protein
VAITLPLVLLIGLGVTDIGRAFYYREGVTNSARQALRVAVLASQQPTANTACASTSGGPLALVVTSLIPPSGGNLATIANAAALESSNSGAPAGSAIAGATLSVTFHCLNGLAVTNSTTNGNGPTDPGSDAVTVKVSYRLNVITPLLWPVVGSTFPIATSSSQRSEY